MLMVLSVKTKNKTKKTWELNKSIVYVIIYKDCYNEEVNSMKLNCGIRKLKDSIAFVATKILSIFKMPSLNLFFR